MRDHFKYIKSSVVNISGGVFGLSRILSTNNLQMNRQNGGGKPLTGFVV